MTSVHNSQRCPIVGLYGIPGCGKSHLLSKLKTQLGEEKYVYHEESKVIGTVPAGDLAGFRAYREQAIRNIRKNPKHGCVTVVTGHFMFWEPTQPMGKIGFWEQDTARKGPCPPVDHIRAWQKVEKAELRRLCHEHRIIFSLLGAHQDAANLIGSVWHHDEDSNLRLAKHHLREALGGNLSGKTVLMLDADKTLCSQNTGELWWRMYRQHYPSDESDESNESDDSDKSDVSDESDGSDGRECPLRRLFNGPLGYSYAAFRQAVFLYEEAADDQKFDEICEGVASNVNVHPEFINLLWHVFDDTCVKAVVVTSGIRLVWEKVLTREGLSDNIKVVGGGRIKDTFVVTPTVKGALVDYLRKTLEAKVWAFGASRMDLGMLRNADQAFVVVGEEANRSTTMDEALMDEFTNDKFQPKQVLLPVTSSPRLDTKVLPITTLDRQMFLDLLFRGSKRVTVSEATDTDASRVLTTPTRNPSISGPALQNAHRDAGRYLALAYLPNVVGIEDYSILHVQGHQVTGYRLQGQHHTSIIALMRGGEPLARGIYDYLPGAAFIHAKVPDDVCHGHLQNQKTVILADWVIDSGQTVAKFLRHIRKLTPDVGIIVVAGVVQGRSIAKLSPLQALVRYGDLTIALRKSDNEYKSEGETETGNRLYNTLHLP
ncbi:uncharacterized protein BO72DRAFT_506703 [Aspergillus fijiensis CBS 313.89]|uniref:Phosphoribosyltransferase domain-containing protein n=1 Tax=Aspergillus fijiensis CBS 313.89 TaxID=1448319 RepID=A0A8G1RUK2_9EURO|nr:uncharacterized protein BO72DRAFT_506703 [Aspergillus fijiensis CBS 313.89]RAK78972.1 hypothetical protein BO72DRAFT_506703 [Aspergillus fijiensis CBS 313.89]